MSGTDTPDTPGAPDPTFLPPNVIIGFHTGTNQGVEFYRITIKETGLIVEGNVPQDVLDRISLASSILKNADASTLVADTTRLLN